MTFAEWLARLDECARLSGFKGETISKITGPDCWRSDYEAGVSPYRALRISEADGEKFGEDYTDI